MVASSLRIGTTMEMNGFTRGTGPREYRPRGPDRKTKPRRRGTWYTPPPDERRRPVAAVQPRAADRLCVHPLAPRDDAHRGSRRGGARRRPAGVGALHPLLLAFPLRPHAVLLPGAAHRGALEPAPRRGGARAHPPEVRHRAGARLVHERRHDGYEADPAQGRGGVRRGADPRRPPRPASTR